MKKVRRNHNGNIVYFKFFASEDYPNCFWYTNTTENFGFELGNVNDYTPIKNSWKEIKANEI